MDMHDSVMDIHYAIMDIHEIKNYRSKIESPPVGIIELNILNWNMDISPSIMNLYASTIIHNSINEWP